MDRRIIWQPVSLYHPGSEFGIYLDRNFAKEMINTNLFYEERRKFNELPQKLFGSKLFDFCEPFQFYGNTGLVLSFDLGKNGKWLSITNTGGRNPLETTEDNLEYRSHNIDDAFEQKALLSLVDFYAQYADSLKGK
jgi:hypothetical protein